jgi:hypothetical protein
MRGDGVTGGQGDKETARRIIFLYVTMSPCPIVPLSLCKGENERQGDGATKRPGDKGTLGRLESGCDGNEETIK